MRLVAHTMTPLATSPSRTDLVVEAIKKAILAGDLQPGEPLVEQSLARSLGVSKTPVREALKILSSSGLVVMSNYRGASVRKVDRNLVQSVYELRILLEPAALKAAFSGERPSVVHMERAREVLACAHQAIEDGDYASLSVHNRAFHRELYQGCENKLLVSVLDELQDQAALISVTGWQLRASWEKELVEHERILEALHAGDVPAAVGLLHEHIEQFAACLISRIANEVQAEDLLGTD